MSSVSTSSFALLPGDEFTYDGPEGQFIIKISSDSSDLIFNIKDIEPHHVPVRRYSTRLTLSDLISKSKVFRMFDTIT